MNKKNNSGCLSGIIGTLLVLVGVAIYAVISSLIDGAFASIRMGDGAEMILFPMRLTGIIVSFVLFEAIFILWQLKASHESSRDGDKGGRMKKIFRFASIGCICASLLIAVVFSNFYVHCREDSISKVTPFSVKEYRWDDRCDVARYVFTCDEEGGLSFNVVMYDNGEVIELFASPASVSDGFREKFKVADVKYLAYAAHLAESFESSSYTIEGKVSGIESMERIYKDSDPEIWAEIEKIILLQEQ